jgi:GR25 family glycosyltransferase involved in LPS biosynthesis
VEIVYLNLASRPDRNGQFLRLNAGLADFRRVDAVVGADQRADDLIRGGVIAEALTAFTSGALGNALSHKRIWEQVAAGDAVVTVAEDDAAINRHFPGKAPEVLAKLPPDWDIILWGWNFDSVLHAGIMNGIKEAVTYFDARPLGPAVADFQSAEYDVIPLRLVNAFGIVSYSVSPAGARRLLAACFPLRNDPVLIPGLNNRLLANISLDATMNRHYRALTAFACFPPLVWTENDHGRSDVARK